jgi:hypothetical protein
VMTRGTRGGVFVLLQPRHAIGIMAEEAQWESSILRDFVVLLCSFRGTYSSHGCSQPNKASEATQVRLSIRDDEIDERNEESKCYHVHLPPHRISACMFARRSELWHVCEASERFPN